MRDTDTRSRAAEETCAAIHEFAEELTRHAPLPGGVLIVADQNGLLAQAPFGHADLERRISMTERHLFEIGSISKVFTSLLAGLLVEDGLLDLNESITDVLPWLDLGRQAPPVTVAQLLNHTAGIVVGADALPDETAQIWSLRQRTTSAAATREFHYSNVGYMLTGLAISARTGYSVPDLVTERLFAPMGMSRAVAAVTHADRPRFATGYTPAREDQPWAPGDLLAPAPWFEVATADGNIAATGADMARLVMLLLGEGTVEGRRVVTPSTLTAMNTVLAPGGEPVLEVPGVPRVHDSRYGLGINVERARGSIYLTHGGGMVGYSTFLLADKSTGIGIVVLTNANGDNLHAQLLARVGHADLISRLDGTPRPRLPNPDPSARCQSAEAGAVDQIGLGRFVQIGSTAAHADLTISVGASGEILLEQAGKSGRLYRTLSGRFVTDHPGMRRFHLDQVPGAHPPRWSHGPDLYASIDEPADTLGELAELHTPNPAWEPLLGHYRTYSPWYPTLRIISRCGRLLLVAPGGVEAPSQEEELVEIATGVFRIGADPWLPERLVAGPIVDGRVTSLDRDGCTYSRAFTP